MMPRDKYIYIYIYSTKYLLKWRCASLQINATLTQCLLPSLYVYIYIYMCVYTFFFCSNDEKSDEPTESDHLNLLLPRFHLVLLDMSDYLRLYCELYIMCLNHLAAH